MQHSLNTNLPGWRWARIKQLALAKSSSSPHSEACKASGGPSGVVHSKISVCGTPRSRECQPGKSIGALSFCYEARVPWCQSANAAGCNVRFFGLGSPHTRLISGGVSQRPVNRVVARSMKRRCMCCGPCIGRVESSSRSKGGLCKGGIAEALTSWQSKKLASLQAGNRAEKMTRSVQWRDRELERSVRSPWYSRQLARLLVAFLPLGRHRGSVDVLAGSQRS